MISLMMSYSVEVRVIAWLWISGAAAGVVDRAAGASRVAAGRAGAVA